MDNAIFQERAKRLKEVNDVIKDLDPTIREAALPLIAEYVTGYASERKPSQEPSGCSGNEVVPQNTAEFFAKFPDGKPSDNAVLIAASLYGQYGAEPFRLGEIRGGDPTVRGAHTHR